MNNYKNSKQGDNGRIFGKNPGYKIRGVIQNFKS